jgi:hypothetical protein
MADPSRQTVHRLPGRQTRRPERHEFGRQCRIACTAADLGNDNAEAIA